MALITDAATSWSVTETLVTDEIWQARKGRVFISTTPTPAANDGLELFENHAVRLTAGTQVKYRKENTGDALIVREAV